MTAETLRWSASGIADRIWLERVEALLLTAWESAPDLPPTDRQLLELAVSEIASNMIKHAVYAHCELELTVATKSLVVRMTDEGPDAAATDLNDRDLPDAQSESGRGLVIARRALDVFEHQRRDGKNHWLLVRRLR